VTIVAILTYAVMAGFFTQSGIILGPAAAAFGRSLTETEPMFAYLLGGNFIGIVVSLAIFDVLSIKATLTFAYAILFAGVAFVCAAHGFAPVTAGVALVGFGGGLGLSSGAVIISKTYAAQLRASAFLGTDCAFSLTGFVIPPVVSGALARGYPWPVGYVIVALLAGTLLLGAAWVRFPPTRKAEAGAGNPRARLGPSVLARIALFGLALSLYLFGQSVFLIWAPSYVQTVFALPAREAANVVSSFWGPSIFGLITAALVVSRVAPRIVLVSSMSVTTGCLVLIATAATAAQFFGLTLAFGFVSTCMYKLMISVGSEQLVAAPPRLVTFLLLSGSVGGTLAPLVSAGIVHAFGPHGGPFLALGSYGAALVAVLAALALERSARGVRLAAGTAS
jgi:TsgA-like MFS transporter